ncbi:MAG: His-Xaa-Ser system radical SAM maturase HxsB [Candidatus Aenigmatarchaeota archaeon]
MEVFLKKNIDYKINKYKYTQIDDKFLITTINGGWALLTKEEFDLLRHEKVEKDPKLFVLLEAQGIIITENNLDRVIEMFKKRNSFLFDAVKLHIITVTQRCNHRCVYCHAKSVPLTEKGYDMDEKTAKKTVDFIFQCPSKYLAIEFQGGEPLLNFSIIEYIVEYSKKLAQEKNKIISFNIVSNFSLMDEDILQFLIKNNFNINTSLDGPKHIHNKNRVFTDGSSYDKVIHWIKVIKDEYKYPLSALPTITKFSLPFHKEIIDEYRALGFSTIRIRQLNNAGFAKERWENIGYTPQEFIEFWKKSLDYIIEINLQGTKMIEEYTQIVLEKFVGKKYPNYTCWGSPCGAAISQCGYNYNGDIYVCDEARSFDMFKIGHVNQSYNEVFQSATVANIVNLTSNMLTQCLDCVWKPFCGPCMICTFGQQNTLMGNMKVDNECFIRRNIIETVIKKLMSKEREILLGWI